MLRHLAEVRARGYDIDDDEMNDSAWAVAAPVQDLTGRVRAAVTVVAPVTTVPDARRRDVLKDEVLASAAAISVELGHEAEGAADLQLVEPDGSAASTYPGS